LSVPLSVYRKLPHRLPHSLGFIKHGLWYDGTDDNVVVTDAASIRNLSAWTLEAFILPEGYGEGNFGRIFDKVGATNGLYLLISDQGSATWPIGSFGAVRRCATTDAVSISVANQIPLNKVSHLCATYDDAGDRHIRLYLNGEETTYHRYDAGAGAMEDDTGDLYIGNKVALDSTFEGIILGELRMYNRVLSDYERLRNIREYHNPTRTGLVLWLRMTEGMGATLVDQSGQGNNGTITGCLWQRVRKWRPRADTCI